MKASAARVGEKPPGSGETVDENWGVYILSEMSFWTAGEADTVCLSQDENTEEVVPRQKPHN